MNGEFAVYLESEFFFKVRKCLRPPPICVGEVSIKILCQICANLIGTSWHLVTQHAMSVTVSINKIRVNKLHPCFGSRGSEVQILSPRPLKTRVYGDLPQALCFVCVNFVSIKPSLPFVWAGLTYHLSYKLGWSTPTFSWALERTVQYDRSLILLLNRIDIFSLVSPFIFIYLQFMDLGLHFWITFFAGCHQKLDNTKVINRMSAIRTYKGSNHSR